MTEPTYTYQVIWSEEDQEFVGLCLEFPHLSWLEETWIGALSGIFALVAEVLEDMDNEGDILGTMLLKSGETVQVKLSEMDEFFEKYKDQIAYQDFSDMKPRRVSKQ